MLVECHDDDRGAIALAKAGLAEERLLALLERDRIDHALALELLQAGLEHRPFRAVDHYRHGRDVGLGRDPPQEAGHRGNAVEHRLVHVHVDELGAIGDLLAGDVDRLVLLALRDEPGELARSGHVGPFTDVHECVARRRDDDRFEPRQVGPAIGGHCRSGRQPGDGGGDGLDMGRRRTAAPARDVQQAVPSPLAERVGHGLGRLVVAAQLVGQARVGVGRNRPVGDPRQHVEVLPELARTERAVEPDDDRIGMADAVPERFDGLSGQRSTGRVDDRAGHDHRQPLADLVEQRLQREDRRLRVERVEDRLDEQDVGAALDQPGCRVVIRLLELGPGDRPGRGVTDVRADRGGPICRPQRPGDEARARRIARLGGVGGGPRESCGRDVELTNDRIVEAVVGLRDAGGGERVRRDDVGARIEIGGVDRPDGGRLGQREQVVVAAQVARMVT